MPSISGVVMIVDDDPMIRALCRSKFEENGYAVLEAENGDRAVKLLKAEKVDVVFLDILMPDKDGLETLLELKKLQPEARVYAMSGGGRRGSSTYLEIAERFGASGVIKKPFTPGMLVDLVRADGNRVAMKSSPA